MVNEVDGRVIAHIDMDCFFVSVALLQRPDAVGKPSAVSGRSARSVISSASYEARAFGVSSAMSVLKAKQLCPQLILLDVDMEVIRQYSRRVMQILGEFTPIVEQVSVDEAYLDLTGSVGVFGAPEQIAAQIRARIRGELGLPASVGLSSTKYVAKLASGAAKPDGVKCIPPSQALAYVRALPVRKLGGVGSATAKKLASRGITQVAQIAETSLESLTGLLGRAAGEHLWKLAHGIDEREVVTERAEKSVGKEITFDADVTDRARLRKQLLQLVDSVASTLRRKGVGAKTIAVKIRWHTFETIAKAQSVTSETNSTKEIYGVALEIFERIDTGSPVRLIGVRAENLGEITHELPLWGEETENRKEVDAAVDAVRGRFGNHALRSARLL